VPRFPDVLTLAPIAHAAGAVRLPGSKSLSNRALLLAALAQGDTLLVGLLDADDTQVMRAALTRLGIEQRPVADGLRVCGCDGRFPSREAELFLGNAGTAFRSLTAALAFAGGSYGLDGVPRMRERPIADLVDALNALGARISYREAAGYPPLLISPATQLTTDRVSIKGDVSSQYLSGLLMAAPLAAPDKGLTISPQGRLISQPYVDMTLAIMASFGVVVERQGNDYRVPRSRFRSPGRYAIEGDASGASYFLALGAIAGGPVRVEGVGRHSLQGDVHFADKLTEMGAQIEWGDDWIEARAPVAGRLAALDADCNAIPDAAMTLAIAALFAEGTSTLRNIGSWRVKETDRIAAMATELRKLGATVAEGADRLQVTPPLQWQPAAIDTYDDHRMAMCFALAAAGGVPVTIREPACVGKTFPDYFDRIASLVSHGPRERPHRAQARS
jgi:3-phosphoshikimate 1-carboxyvinyltransferase